MIRRILVSLLLIFATCDIILVSEAKSFESKRTANDRLYIKHDERNKKAALDPMFPFSKPVDGAQNQQGIMQHLDPVTSTLATNLMEYWFTKMMKNMCSRSQNNNQAATFPQNTYNPQGTMNYGQGQGNMQNSIPVPIMMKLNPRYSALGVELNMVIPVNEVLDALMPMIQQRNNKDQYQGFPQNYQQPRNNMFGFQKPIRSTGTPGLSREPSFNPNASPLPPMSFDIYPNDGNKYFFN